MEEFDKYTKALKEYQEYSRSYNEQVQKLRGLIVCHEKKCAIRREVRGKGTQGDL